MTPKEKAIQLMVEFGKLFVNDLKLLDKSKSAALVACDLLIDLSDRASSIEGTFFRLTESGAYGDSYKEYEFWEKVKEEIKKS